MSPAHRPALVVVGDVGGSSPEAILAATVPALIEAERTVSGLRRVMTEAGRELARDRGVAFIRPERLIAEFRNVAR